MRVQNLITSLARGLTVARSTAGRTIAIAMMLTLVAAACADDDAATTDTTTEETTTTEAPAEETTTTAEADADVDGTTDAAPTEPTTSVRDSGMRVTVQQAGAVMVHTLTAPEEVFANSTHIIETENTLVLVDTQFLLPNAVDFRAYADDLGKPIDRVFITHEHPDHFLGSEAFADLPIFALEEVSTRIAEIGDAEVEEKQADFGPEAIASTYVVPEVVEPGTLEIDGITFELTEVRDAEADFQLVIRLPGTGAIVVGDIIYSGVHLILAGQPDTWTVAINGLVADSDEYPIVLPGHGLPDDPSVYDENIAWLATASELIATVDTSEEFKQGLVDAYPDLGMTAAIDFVFPFLFPDE
ncbi:MAG: MBL fold metallo-hydrolase [Actinomycetota bacterium]